MSVDLPSVKSIVNTEESFSVSCEFRARPSAGVVWKREDGSDLPSDIFSTQSSTEVDGKFTVRTNLPQFIANRINC